MHTFTLQELEGQYWYLYGTYLVFKILSSNAEFRNALARNLHHIWKLTLGADELAYFYNCMLGFQETNNSHTTDTPVTSRPTWLPSLDTDTRLLIPSSPMTSLSRLVVSMRTSFTRSYTLPSVHSPRTILAQLSWLISLHPGLASLEVFTILILDIHGARLLGGIISGMSNLEMLRLNVYCGSEDWFALCSHLFFSCPPSLEQLTMDFFENNKNDTTIEDWSEYGGHKAEEIDKDEARAARKQEPLVNMEQLSLREMYLRHWNTATDRSMFAHCPNVKSLDMSSIIGLRNSNTIGEFIGKNCPKIESIIHRSLDFEEHGLLAFEIPQLVA